LTSCSYSTLILKITLLLVFPMAETNDKKNGLGLYKSIS
jgi:hypothetical protein